MIRRKRRVSKRKCSEAERTVLLSIISNFSSFASIFPRNNSPLEFDARSHIVKCEPSTAEDLDDVVSVPIRKTPLLGLSNRPCAPSSSSVVIRYSGHSRKGFGEPILNTSSTPYSHKFDLCFPIAPYMPHKSNQDALTM